MPYIMGDDDKKIRFLVIHWLLAKGVRSDARSFFHVIPSVICHVERPPSPCHLERSREISAACRLRQKAHLWDLSMRFA